MARWYHFGSAFFILQGIEAFSAVDRLAYGEWTGKPGDKITQSLNLLLVATSIALFCNGFPRIKSVHVGALFALAVGTFLLLSSVWSVNPQTSLREAILYFFVVLGAIGIATTLKCDEYMELLALSCFLAAVASAIFVVVSHGTAYTREGDFRGIFSQKNVIGEAMAIGALASLHMIRVSKRTRFRYCFFLLVLTMTALMSRSATSCLVIAAFCGTHVAVALIRSRGVGRILGIGAMVFALPLVAAAAAFPDAILGFLGKDPTLTGRTDIWALVIPDIFLKPWLGWGYMTFWSSSNPAAVQISDTLHWSVPQAHNGLLEMLLNVGLIGTVIFMFLWARTVRLSLRCMKMGESALATTCLASCVGIILMGISETVLIVPFEASTSVFFITGFFCERAVRTARLRRWRIVANRSDFLPARAG